MPSECKPFCGDGLIKMNETCDDRNTKENDGCSLNCQVEVGWTCTGTPSECKTTCGDGLMAGLEECDDPIDPICSSSCKIHKSSQEYITNQALKGMSTASIVL